MSGYKAVCMDTVFLGILCVCVCVCVRACVRVRVRVRVCVMERCRIVCVGMVLCVREEALISESMDSSSSVSRRDTVLFEHTHILNPVYLQCNKVP